MDVIFAIPLAPCLFLISFQAKPAKGIGKGNGVGNRMAVHLEEPSKNWLTAG